MSKKDLRKAMLVSLEQVGNLERRKIEKAMRTHLFESDLWKQAQTVGLTLSMGNEWDTRELIEQAWAEGKRVGVPKSIHESRELHFYEITSFDQVAKGYFNLEEPLVSETKRIQKESFSLLLVPGLIFTESGYRIGFGGGFYDRFLAEFNQPTVSLVHTNQLVESFPIEAHDVPVDYLVTEEACFKTGL